MYQEGGEYQPAAAVETADDNKKRVKILQKLHEFGIVRESEMGNVWDLEGLRRVEFKHKGGKEGFPTVFFHQRPITRGEFFYLLRNEVGVSQDDYAEARVKGRPPCLKKIFYSPPDKKAALDAEKIRQDDSYLGIWDLGGGGGGRRQTDWSEEIELASGEKIGTDELFLSRKIYHDWQGRRGEGGKLMVKDDGRAREFSATWFAEKSGFRGAGNGWDAPVRYLVERCPNLLRFGLLNLGDMKAVGSSSELYRETRPIAPNGMVRIGGAGYCLLSFLDCDARKNPAMEGRFKIIKLTDDLAGVVTEGQNGSGITHLFRLKTMEDKEAKIVEIKRRRPDLAESKERGGGEKVKWGAYITFGKGELDFWPVLAPDLAKEIFAKYIELVKAAESVSGQATKFFQGGRGVQEADLNKAALDVLKRAAALLADYAKKQSGEPELWRQLDRMREDMVIFSSIFKTLFKGKEAVDFSEIRGLDLERITLRDLQGAGAAGVETMEEMARVHAVNREDQGEAGEASAEKFRKFLRSGADSQFYILRKNGKLAAFIRFDALADKPGRKYAAALNVDPAYRGSAIGQAMYFTIFEEEAKKAVLEFVVYPANEVGTMYVESGSILTGVDKSGHYFTGERNIARRSNLRGAEMDRQELEGIFSRQREENILALLKRGEEAVVRCFDMSVENEVRQAMDTMALCVRNGYVCSRYFYADPKNKNIRYFVFEREKAAEAKDEAEDEGGGYRKAA